MATATVEKTMAKDAYTKLTTASTGYALIYNPQTLGTVLNLYVGPSAPAITVTTAMALNPDEAFQRTSDITDFVWGWYTNNDALDAVVTE